MTTKKPTYKDLEKKKKKEATELINAYKRVYTLEKNFKQISTNTSDKFPDCVLEKWQEIANILAEIIDIPAALIMKAENESMEVFISSQTENNPYRAGQKEKWYGLYCETVIKTQNKLLVQNATKDKNWDKNPDIKLGMIAYLGFPINFPDNQPFGTLCVLDNKERPFSLLNEKIIQQFKSVIELDLALIQSFELKTNQFAATITQSVSERKKMEETLRETNLYLESLFLSPYAPIIVWDTQFNITRFNPAFEELTGRKAREVIGKPIKILFPPALANESMELIRKATTGEQWQTAEINIQHINGSISIVLWNSANVLDTDNKNIIATIAQGHNITHRKLLEGVLHFQSEILSNMSEAVYLARMEDGIIVYTNSNFEKMFGYQSDEMIGRHVSIVNNPTEKDPKETTKEILNFINENGYWNGEIQNIKKDGTVFWSYACVTLFIHSIFGKVLLTIYTDITQRKKNELEIQQLLENLEISNKELEQFAYVSSHDLQEPLRMIASYTQLLEKRYKDKLDADALDFIHYAVEGANRLQKLINDLLDYSRITSRGRELEKVDTSMILGYVISNLQQLIAENSAFITIDDLPLVQADESQLVRLFQNLIANAIKFKKKTESPKIHISCKKKNNLYEFSVSDNGIGIDMQYQEKIFTIFQRLHTIKDYPGTGIGLAICKRIVERHGGTIWFESKENEGSTFYFTLKV